MKRNLRLSTTGLLLMGIACACSEDALEGVNGSGDQQQGTTTLVATTDAYTQLAKTRTQVGGIDAESGALYIEWSAGDCIGVFGSATANAMFKGTNTEPAASTSFTGDMAEAGDVPQYAYYPYSADVTDMTRIPVTIPTEQMYADESSLAQYDAKAASTIEASADGGWRVRFRQMTALVRFEIDLSGVESLADDELLLDIEIAPTADGGAPMTGEFTYDLTNLDAGLVAGSSTAKGIKLAFAYPPTARETVVAYAAVAPGSHEGEEWTCTFTTDRQIGTFTTTALCDFEAGTFYTVPLTATILSNNDAQYEPAPEEETANCYITTGEGDYDFKATVIGNGPEGIIPNAGFHTENPYINPKSAKVLWSSSMNFVSDVRLENGRVHYHVNSSSGNAVIAVYSEPDCQGEILWSWHIWGTIGTPEDEEYTNQAGAKFMVMDRDLGAVRVGDSRVVLYQWGRKDPVLTYYAPPYYYVDGMTEVNIQRGWPTMTIENATIADAIQNPSTIIWSGNNDNRNWLGEANCYLWGDADRTLPEDLTDARCGAGWNNQKTIYDPSPVGYRVANIFTFSGFTSMPGGDTGDLESQVDGHPICLQRLDYINFIKANNSDDWWFKKNADDTEGSCWPGIGARSGRSGAGQGTNAQGYNVGGRWWSAEAFMSADGEPQACYLMTDEWTDSAPVSQTNGNEIDTYCTTALLRDLHGVRCVREEN